MKTYLLQAFCDKKWLTCYEFKTYESALEHKSYLDKEYPRQHRIISK
jgi:hypothetical protein